MRLDTEMRIQGAMLVGSFIGMIGMVVLIVLGVIYSSMPFFVGAAGLFAMIYAIIAVGSRWTQQTMDRVKKIREGGGDEADLEWLKSRKSPGFTKVNKDK